MKFFTQAFFVQNFGGKNLTPGRIRLGKHFFGYQECIVKIGRSIHIIFFDIIEIIIDIAKLASLIK